MIGFWMGSQSELFLHSAKASVIWREFIFEWCVSGLARSGGFTFICSPGQVNREQPYNVTLALTSSVEGMISLSLPPDVLATCHSPSRRANKKLDSAKPDREDLNFYERGHNLHSLFRFRNLGRCCDMFKKWTLPDLNQCVFEGL